VIPGYHCMSADEAVMRQKEGWQFLAIGSELKFMLSATSEVLKKVGAERAAREMAKY
jgi:4-hydroxy-2-oxoheptanedioate aldolase